MDWYVVDKKYVEYLQSFDNKVGHVEYGDKLKLHVGIMVEVDGCKYYVPVSSPKEKHKKMSNNLDFHKIVDPADDTLYAVININNMIPVPDECIIQLKYNEIEGYRSFADEKDKTDYIYLLQKEKVIIDNIESVLKGKAIKLYSKVKSNPESNLTKRCCNFVLLQEKALEYNK